jgi:hypothetical protein
MNLVMKKIGLILLGIIVAVLLSFLVDRVLGIYLNKTGYFTLLTPDMTEIYDTNEFHVTARISSQGLRNEVVKKPKPQNVYRILVLGDSFTFGWGVKSEETWVKLLEKKVSVKGKKVEVINAGAPGMYLAPEIQACKAYADQFQVDAIVLGFYGVDDLYQVTNRQVRTNTSFSISDAWPTFSRVFNTNIIDSWHENSRGKTYISHEYWKNAAERFLFSHPDILQKLDPEIRNDYVQGEVGPALIANAYTDPGYFIDTIKQPAFSYSMNAILQSFQKLVSQCAHTKPVVVIFLPSLGLVTNDLNSYRSKMGFSIDPHMNTYDIDTTLSKVVRQAGLEYISLLPEMRKTNCAKCFFHWDGHFTPYGHQMTANVVKPQLEMILNKHK